MVKKWEVSVSGSVQGWRYLVVVTWLDTFSAQDRQAPTLTSIVVVLYVDIFPSNDVWLRQVPDQNKLLFQNAFKTFDTIIALKRNVAKVWRRTSSLRTIKLAFCGLQNKHVDIRYHICWEATGNGKLWLEYCPSTEMMADPLTKPLGPQKRRSIISFMPLAFSFPKTSY